MDRTDRIDRVRTGLRRTPVPVHDRIFDPISELLVTEYRIAIFQPVIALRAFRLLRAALLTDGLGHSLLTLIISPVYGHAIAGFRDPFRGSANTRSCEPGSSGAHTRTVYNGIILTTTTIRE